VLSVERWALKNLSVEDPIAFAAVTVSKNEAGALFDLLDRLDDGVEVRPVAGVEFGMEQFTIGANLEGAAARGNERERLDALAELKNFGRQTDGLRRVVSNDAVFDRDLGFHQRAPFRGERIGMKKAGQAVEALDIS
jgi:hypothetical protein